jgi:RNA polymerase sigma factor (sigma-70 family)
MVRLAVILLDSDAFAEDLVHDAFIRVRAHWRSIEHPQAYLRRTVVNACRSSRRRLHRERRAARFAVAQVYDLEVNELLDALAKLPYRQRAAVALRYYEGLTYAEIGEALECPEGTAASLLRRGVAQLRRTVEL